MTKLQVLAAATITVRATLEMLDGSKREIAEGVANDRYALWLGSGISRDRMPDLKRLAKCVLITLQSRIDQRDATCRFRRALQAIVTLAQPSEAEWANVDYALNPDQWPDCDTIAGRLVRSYAQMLNVTVDGEEADYLLWDVLNAAALYSDPTITPDVEHLCLAALAMEGVASEIPSANWDPLVERAIQMLAGSQPVLRVVVAAEDLRESRRRVNLYKFHGCAQAAHDDPSECRNQLVARQSQITGWYVNNVMMGNFLTNLIATKATLMLGLSAQDSNIQSLFARAQAQLAWRWPSHPPAYAFSENALGSDQESLLQNVYQLDYKPMSRPQMATDSLIQAYAKPLLISLLLFVIAAKLQLLIARGLPELANADRDKLQTGVVHARNVIADALIPTADVVTELLLLSGRTLSMLRDGSLPDGTTGIYTPVSQDPLDRMPADPTLRGSGMCQFAVASGLIGLGLDRGHWAAAKPDAANLSGGALILIGRSGPAKVYFAASQHAAIHLGTNGLVAQTDDAVIIHSHVNPPRLPRYPRRAPGRTGLATLREVSIDELLAARTNIEDLLEGFRSMVAL